jgi:hypothetical protein
MIADDEAMWARDIQKIKILDHTPSVLKYLLLLTLSSNFDRQIWIFSKKSPLEPHRRRQRRLPLNA